MICNQISALRRQSATLCLCISAYAASAQVTPPDSTWTDGLAIPDVTVTARRTPPAVTSAAPLFTVDRAGLERIGAYGVADAVRRFAGVSVKDYGGIGGLKTVSIRSLGAQHTGVSYDGVFVSNCQSGQVDLSRFSTDNVECISLAIGQTDSIFVPARAFASAGTLDIRTTIPHKEGQKTSWSVGAKGGSFGMAGTSLRMGVHPGERTSIGVNGEFLRADGAYPFTLQNGENFIKGKRINSDIHSYRAEVDLRTRFGQKQTLQAKAYFFDSQRGLPGGVIYDNPYSAERLWDQIGFGQFRYENRFSPRTRMQVSGKFNYSWNRNRNVQSSGITDDRFRQTETYVSATAWHSPLKGLSFSLANDFAYNYLTNSLDGCVYPQRYTVLTAGAARYATDRLSVTASVLHTYITEHVRTGQAAPDRTRWSPAVGLSWRPFNRSALRVRLSYKDIFRTPTFNDLYYSEVGNTRLKPETTRQTNLGLTWSGASGQVADFVTVSADVYYNRVNDKIVAMPTMFVWKMMNVGKVETIGLDLSASVERKITDRLKVLLTGNYSFMQADDITNPDSKSWRNQLIYTPRHSGSTSCTLSTPWVDVTYNLMGSSERYTMAQNLPSNRIAPYTDHSIVLSRTLKWRGHGIRLQADASNLGGKNYEIIRFYPMPGRSFRFSVTYTH